MNEQTTKLLEQLAEQLGTTAEYLWSVLIKQAPIDGYIGIMQFAALVVAMIALSRIGKAFWKKWLDDDSELVVPYAIAYGICTILLILSFLLDIVALPTNFLNPEYWALKQVMNAVQ